MLCTDGFVHTLHPSTAFLQLSSVACMYLNSDWWLHMWQVQHIAHNRHRERLAKEQGIPSRLFVMKRPGGLSEPGDKKRKYMPAATVRFQAAFHLLCTVWCSRSRSACLLP